MKAERRKWKTIQLSDVSCRVVYVFSLQIIYASKLNVSITCSLIMWRQSCPHLSLCLETKCHLNDRKFSCNSVCVCQDRRSYSAVAIATETSMAWHSITALSSWKEHGGAMAWPSVPSRVDSESPHVDMCLYGTVTGIQSLWLVRWVELTSGCPRQWNLPFNNGVEN